MMRGLFMKAVREAWFATLLFGLGIYIVMGLLTFILPQLQADLSDIWSRLPLARNFLSAMLGVEIDEVVSVRNIQAIVWVHPVMLALMWAHEIIFCTRTPAGEIDRGTIDILLGWPVSRRQVYLCESAVWLVSGILLLTMGFLGHLTTRGAMEPEYRPGLDTAAILLTNLFCLYIAVGGMAYFFSALSDRRGRAVGMVFGLLLASFLLNFLAQFWIPAENVSFLSIMDYYKPGPVLMSNNIPVGDMLVLVMYGFVLWVAGGEIVARRNICTT